MVARNPDPESTLPYLVRLPLGRGGVVLKARDTWPRTSKVYCHPADGWPADAEIVERVPTRACARRGAAIDLVLDRARENRSQIVFAQARGRQVIFWQSARTAKHARPSVRLPTARAAQLASLVVLVDAHEHYPYRFAHQQAEVVRRALPAGDYAVELDGSLVAVVERKSLADLGASLLNGRLRFALTELAGLPRAAVVVEDRYSAVYRYEHARPAALADALAEAQVRYPSVPIVFCETRALGEEWTYRYLAAALAEAQIEAGAQLLVAELPIAGGLAAPVQAASTAEVRAWARGQGLPVSDRGRLRPEVVAAYEQAHGG